MRLVATVVALVFSCITAFAQSAGCAQIHAVVQMAKAKTPEAVRDKKSSAGADYRADLVFAFRIFEMKSTAKTAAVRLLEMIPRDADQQNVVLTLGDAVCNDESLAEMKALAKVADGLAVALSRAVKLAPEYMGKYVAYASIATQDPHSDYAVQMSTVCHSLHASFVKAVAQLPESDKQSFHEHIMKTESCKVLALPEAE